jgi:hypothetical protein
MPSASARAIWCHTCGEYVPPGSHGIHPARYGRGPANEPPAEEVTSLHAVALVVAIFAGIGFTILLVVLWVSRAGR